MKYICGYQTDVKYEGCVSMLKVYGIFPALNRLLINYVARREEGGRLKNE